MAAYLKQPIVVENISGATTLLAIRHVVKSPPDGYPLLVGANTMVTLPHVNPQAGYAVKDFSAIGEMVRSPLLLVTSASSPFKSLTELITAAKSNPQQVAYACGGVGTTNHLWWG